MKTAHSSPNSLEGMRNPILAAALVSLGLIALVVATLALFPATASAQSSDVVWALQETLVNPNNADTEITGGPVQGRAEGSHYRWTVSETSISYSTRSVDNGFEWWNVNFTASFDRPPTVLEPDETVELNASVSGSGSVTQGSPGLAFEYRAEGVRERQMDGVTYIAVGREFVTQETTGSFVVPEANSGQIKIHALAWNCAACLVTWIYEPQERPNESPTLTPEPTADSGSGQRPTPASGNARPADLVTRIFDGIRGLLDDTSDSWTERATSAVASAVEAVERVAPSFGESADEPEDPAEIDEFVGWVNSALDPIDRMTSVSAESSSHLSDTVIDLVWDCDAPLTDCTRRNTAGQRMISVLKNDGSEARLGVYVTANGRIQYTTDGKTFYDDIDNAIDPPWRTPWRVAMDGIDWAWDAAFEGRVTDTDIQLQNEVTAEVFENFRTEMSAGSDPKSLAEWGEGQLWDTAIKGPMEKKRNELLWSKSEAVLTEILTDGEIRLPDGTHRVLSDRNLRALEVFRQARTEIGENNPGDFTPKAAWERVKQETGLDLFEITKSGNYAIKSTEFAVETVKELARTGQTLDFTTRAREYFAARENGLEPRTIWLNERENPSGITFGAGTLVTGGTDAAFAQFGVEDSARQGILFTMYEEAYQRYLLAKEMGREGRSQ